MGELRTGSVGLVGTAAQSVASMAPAAAIAFGLGAAVPHAGTALPLAVVIALGVCVVVALSLAALAKHAPSAGGHAAAVGLALGPTAGWLAGWLAGFAFMLVTPATLLVLALFSDSFLREGFHVSLGEYGWAIYVAAYGAIVALLAGLGVRVSAKATIVFGIIELAIFLALAITLAVTSPPVPQAFLPSSSPDGWSGVLFGMLFVFAAFLGFESSATYGEEARDPERTIPKAIVLAAVAIGGVFVFAAYAAVAGWGPANIGGYFKDLSPWITMSMRVWGPAGAALVILAILNSGLGGSVAAVNAGARIVYAMARDGRAPRVFASASKRGTPFAVLAFAGAAAVIAVGAGLAFGAMNGLIVVGASSTVPVLLVYIAICVGVPVFYRRRPDFHVVKHGVLPIVAAFAIGAVIVLHFVPRPAPPQDLVAPIDCVWLAIGVVVVIQRKRAARVSK